MSISPTKEISIYLLSSSFTCRQWLTATECFSFSLSWTASTYLDLCRKWRTSNSWELGSLLLVRYLISWSSSSSVRGSCSSWSTVLAGIKTFNLFLFNLAALWWSMWVKYWWNTNPKRIQTSKILVYKGIIQLSMHIKINSRMMNVFLKYDLFVSWKKNG